MECVVITVNQNSITQKYLEKRKEVLENVSIIQNKLQKPLEIYSEKHKSKQKNVKRKGLSVEWVYQPKTRLLDCVYSLSSIKNTKMSKVYVRVTIYDETHKQCYNDSKKSHLIPLESLVRLFWVADAIRADKLFDLFEDVPPKFWLEDQEPEELNQKREERKRRFFERTHFVYLFGHENVLYDDQEMPKAVSHFTIGFCPKNETGETVRLPWKLTCWDARYDADEVYSTGVCAFRGDQVRETAVVISQDQLLEIVDGIYQTLCQLLGGSL